MPGLHLLFERGERPDLDTLKSAISNDAALSLTHDGVRQAEGSDKSQTHPRMASKGPVHWAEVLRDGLTFDLLGLRPGAGVQPFEAAHRFDCKIAPLSHSAISLWPGPHLAGAENSEPVMRGLMQTALTLTERWAGVVGVGWRPSSGLVGRDYFIQTVSGWIDGGTFPALGLVAYRAALDGALESVGLAFFTGQEVRIEGDLASDRAAATRIAARLVDELVGKAPLTEPLEVGGPSGEALRLEPSRNGRFVRVWKV